jgi:hypothetical protein
LAAGDRVVVLGLQKVMPGATVQPSELTPEALEAAATQENQ